MNKNFSGISEYIVIAANPIIANILALWVFESTKIIKKTLIFPVFLTILLYKINVKYNGSIFWSLFSADPPDGSCLLYVICYSIVQELFTLYINFYHTVDSFFNVLQHSRYRKKFKIIILQSELPVLFSLHLRATW